MVQKDPNAKEGMRVRVLSMVDDPNPVLAGTEGTIVLIDDMGTLHVKWDDGRRLGLIPGIDRYVLEPEEFSNLMDDAFSTIDEADSGKNAINTSINQTPSNIKKSMPSMPSLSKSNVTKNFKTANIKDVKVESNEIKGGKADKLSIKDLAKKHKVSIEDIKKEIKIGVKIEKEHVGNDVNKAKEIAMDHISEFSDYYSNKRYGVLASEKGLKKDKKKSKNKENKTDYMTSTAGGVSTGAYTGNAWGSGPLTKSKEVAKPGPLKEMTYTPDDDISDTSAEAWADKNKDGWKWNDTPLWEEGEIIDPLAKIKTSWDDDNLDISKDWDKVQKKKNLKKEDVLKMVGMRLIESKYEIVNDKNLDSVKDNFKPPRTEDEEEPIEETTTFGSVWGPNGPPVGPAFAAKQGQWRAGKNPIWKGGKIVQKVNNSGVLNPITENKIEVGDMVKIKKEYGGGTGEVVDIKKSFVVVKTKDGNKSYHMSDLITEANKVKYNPDGQIVQIKKKCTKYPYCSQGAIDKPLKISSSVSQPGTYVETELSNETIKNIHEISKQIGRPFIEVYNLVKEKLGDY
jgi:ribosomal protein L21E